MLTITTSSFENDVLHADKPVLVDFWAQWCPYCRRIAPAFDKVGEQYADTLITGKINYDEEPQLIQRFGIDTIPTLLLFKNGEVLGSIVAPAPRRPSKHLSRKRFLSKETAMEKIYDMIVIGGGPAGYTAALYAARAGLSTLVLEKLSAGGQMALTEQIDNYPGFESGIDGFTLGEKMQQSAERFGAVTELAEVYKASLSGRIKTLDTSEGVFQGRTVVIATGATPRPLGVPGEEALVGKGVHYCAACDGAPYRGKTVAVVGGGNSAAADALTLSRIAKKVYLIHRRDSLRATKVYHAPLMNAPNVEFCWNSTVSALLHDSRLTGLRLKDVNTDAEHDLACDGVFISVGRAPATELFRRELALDRSGYIIADESTRTNLPGVFAAGDVRTKALRQVVTAVSDGAVAVHYAEEYLAENR